MMLLVQSQRFLRFKLVGLVVFALCVYHGHLLMAHHQILLHQVRVASVPTAHLLPQRHLLANNERIANEEDQPQATNNKTLVLLIGGLRGGQATWATLHKHVLDVNQADLALMMDASSSLPLPQNCSLLQRAKYVWTAPANYTDWAEAMQELIPHKPPNWRQDLFQETNRNFIALGGAGGIRGSGAIIFMLRYMARQHIQTLGLHQHYDRFIISRPDQYFCSPHNVAQLDPQFVWVPWGQDFKGLCDRHVVLSARHVLQALDVITPLVQRPQEYADILGKPLNTERWLKLTWQQEGLFDLVRRFDRNMFLAAESPEQVGWKKIGQANTARSGGVH